MRSNDSLRRLGANFVKMLVLVMCFATVFAIVMTADLSGIGTDSAGNIAEAAWSGGNTTQIVIENNPADNVLLHASGKLGSAEFTIPYSVAAGSDHVSMSQDGNWANDSVSFYNGGDSSVWGSRGNGNFTASTDITIITAINVKVPQIILNLIAKGFAVNAEFSATIYTKDYTRNDTGIGILSSNAVLSANDARGNNSAVWNTGDRNCKDGTGLKVSTSVTSNSNSNLVLMLSRNLGGRDRQDASQITAEGTTITFTITPPESGISDGNAPKVTSGSWSASIFGQSEAVFDEEGYSSEFARSGSIEGNATSLTLDGFASNSNGFSANNITFAKKVTLNLQDVNADGNGANPADATYYTGLMNVNISGQTLTPSQQSGGGWSGNISSEENWYAEYSLSAARDTGTITIYFNTNGNYTVTVYDSSASSDCALNFKITVSGIDNTAYTTTAISPGANVAMYGDSIEQMSQKEWITNKNQSLTASVGSPDAGPAVWFAYAYFSDTSFDELSKEEVWGKDSLKGREPWKVVGTSARDKRITFDLKDIPTDGGFIDYAPGYYRIVVYALDFRGNFSYDELYFKIDAESITGVNLTKTYDATDRVALGDDELVGVLDPDENAVWATSELTVKLSFVKSFSGNRVRVVGANGEQYRVWIDGAKIVRVTKGENITSTDDGSIEAGGLSAIVGGVPVTLTSTTGESGEVNINLEIVYSADIDSKCSFEITNVARTEISQSSLNSSSPWGGDVYVRVDMTNPQNPSISSDDGAYINKVDATGAPTGENRQWYTEGWTISGKVAFEDASGSGLYTLYYQSKRYTDETEFENKYKEIQNDFSGYKSVDNIANTWTQLTAEEFAKVKTITFGTANEVGYYVVYIFAVDKAGNFSECSAYGAFIDNKTYTIGTRLKDAYSSAFGTVGSAVIYNEIGEVTHSFKRGEKLYFSLKLNNGFVPYEIFKLNATGSGVDDALYSHDDDSLENALDPAYISSSQESYVLGVKDITVSGAKVSCLEMLVDRAAPDELPIGQTSQQGLLVYSCRQVVSATPDGSTTYIGTDIEPHITVTDVNDSELETLIKEEGLSFYTLNKYADNTSGVSGATIRNAGVYYLTLTRAHSEYYVLLNPTEYGTGDDTVRNYSKFTVTRVALGIDASGLGTYGDITADNLSEKITVSGLSGLVGDDIGLVGDDIGSGIKKLAGYSAPVWTVAGFSEGYLGAGTYALTLSGLNLTNYSLTVGNASVTVTPKDISFAAVGGEAVFGDSLPSSVYDITIAKSALTNTAGEAIAADAAAVAEIFGVEESAVRESEDGYNWIVTVGSEGLKLATSDSDYTGGYLNANKYEITLGTVDISKNYDATFIKEEEGGVLVVTQRTVTVRPNSNQSFNIKADEGETIKVQVTFDNNLAGSLISGYMTVVIPPNPEVSGNWNVDLTNLDNIVNPYGPENVLIKAADGTYTVTVNIATGGTFIITYKGLGFEQEYGYKWDFGKLASTAGNYEIDYLDASGASQKAPAYPTFVFNVSGYYSENVLANGIGKYYLTPTVTGFDGDPSLKISDYTYEFYYVSVDDGVTTYPVESIQIVPANVTVTAVKNSGVNSKVYGDVEPAWAFTYEFEGLPDGYGTPSISGIVRANDADGTAAGTRYDDAGKYGAFNAGISCKDRNLNVTLGAGALNTASFVINPKTITLGANDFVGGNKFFDGTSDASAVANINFPAGAIINNDTVTFKYTAKFVNADGEVSAIGDGYEIAFTEIKLDGAASGNYTLKDTAFTTQGGDFSIIRAKISLTTSYYTLLKVFDGSTAINGDYLTINPDAGLELYKASMVVSGFFSSANAGERVSATLVLTLASLPYEEDHLSDIFGNYESLGVEIAPIDADKPESGTVITFNGFIGKIEKRAVHAADVVLDIADNKVYDGTTDVAVSYDFTEGFKGAITGFAPADVGFKISASVDGKNADDTPYEVRLSGATVSGANYVAAPDLESLLDTKAEFIINRRELTLSIEFATAIYSGAMSPTIDGSAIVEGLVAGESATVDSIIAVYSKGDTAWSYVDLDQLEGGNYYHDVLVQSYKVTPGTGFDWMNYQFILADGTPAGNQPDTGDFHGTNLLLKGAAILNPRPVNMLVNAVKAQSKVYDGTTTAKLDFSGAFGVGDADGFVSKEHMDAVLKYITYTANFGTANATPSGLKLTWGNFKIDSASASDADKEIIGSYSFGYTGSQTNIATDAQITHAPIAVEFALPEKAYDGSQYLNVDETKVTVTIDGTINGEPDTYRVVVIAAGYKGGEELDVNDAGRNAGFVYGFTLVNDTRSSVMNYELVFASETENLAGFTAVTDLGANTTLDPSLHYYYFKSYDYWYLNDSELEKLKANAELFAKLNIVSEFNYGNEVMYALDGGNTLTTEDKSQLEALGASKVSTRRANAYGKITPVQLAFEVITTDGDAYAGEDYVFNEEAFVKTFDDSTEIAAVYGALDATEGYDFKLKLTYPDGGTLGDVGFVVTDVEVNFADANFGTRKDVIFRIVGLKTDDGKVNAGNYSFNADGTCTVKSLGEIKKASVIASISGGGNATVTYGEEWNYSVSYETATGSRTVYIDAEGYAYIATADYPYAGFEGTTEGRVTYVTADNGVTFIEGTEGTTYYRLSGKFGQVVPVSGDGSAIVRDGKYVGANVGRYSDVIPVGRADNFIIKGSEGITVTVDKAQLIVAPTDAAEGEYAYSGTYYGSIPVPALAAQSGLAAWDDFATVVNDLTVGFTLSTATTPAAITRRATPSFALSEGYYKLFVSGESSNYTVQLGNGSTEYKLYLALPTLAESTFTVKESLTKVYDAKAVTGADILNGLTSSDTVTVDWAEGADYTNAGTANFAGITVKRTIGDYWYVAPGADEATGISWTSATEGTYTITQRALTVRATSSLNFTYDGTDHQLDRSKLAATSAGGVGDTSGFITNADIKLLFNGEEVSAMRDAGGYTVSISLSASDARNYAVTNNVGTIVVARAPITVSVDAASKTYDVTDGVSGNEAIHFTVASGAVGGDSLTEDDFTVTYRDSSGSVVSAIPTAGVYNYTITCVDPNYTVVGGGTGNISATISGVSYKSGDTTVAQITFSAPVTVDYKLQDTALAEGTPYWSIVEENVRALSDENYDTNGIVRLQLTANGSTVSRLPDGSSVTIRALLPEGVSADNKVFYVNSNGGLTELTDYQIANGYITYTTSYISNLVFVGMPSFVLAWWVYLLIAVLVVLIIAAAILIAVLAKLRRAPDPVEREEEPVEPELVPEPVVAADIAPEAPVIEPVTYDAPAAVSKHGQPPIIGIR